MFRKSLIFSLFVFLVSFSASAQHRDILKECIYKPADSARVVRLLAEKAPQGGEVLYYARKFLGVPYVAATLERSKQERLPTTTAPVSSLSLVIRKPLLKPARS